MGKGEAGTGAVPVSVARLSAQLPSANSDDFPDGAGTQAGGADLLLFAAADRDGPPELPAIIARRRHRPGADLPGAVRLQAGVAIGRNGRAADTYRVLIFAAVGRRDGCRSRGRYRHIGRHPDHFRRRCRIYRHDLDDGALLLP